MHNAPTVLILAPVAIGVARHLHLAPDPLLDGRGHRRGLRLPHPGRPPVQHAGAGARRLPVQRLHPARRAALGAGDRGRHAADRGRLAAAWRRWRIRCRLASGQELWPWRSATSTTSTSAPIGSMRRAPSSATRWAWSTAGGRRSTFGGAWMYIGDAAVVHLVDLKTGKLPCDQAALDHFAFAHRRLGRRVLAARCGRRQVPRDRRPRRADQADLPARPQRREHRTELPRPGRGAGEGRGVGGVERAAGAVFNHGGHGGGAKVTESASVSSVRSPCPPWLKRMPAAPSQNRHFSSAWPTRGTSVACGAANSRCCAWRRLKPARASSRWRVTAQVSATSASA